jgi:hypothetical protein
LARYEARARSRNTLPLPIVEVSNVTPKSRTSTHAREGIMQVIDAFFLKVSQDENGGFRMKPLRYAVR